MSRPTVQLGVFPERTTRAGTRVGFSYWSDGKVRPYGRLVCGRHVYGPARGESHDELDALLADDEFLLAGDLRDGIPDEVA